LDAAAPHARVAEAVDLTWDIDGVIDILDHTGGAVTPGPD
jgi:hypothetical protein